MIELNGVTKQYLYGARVLGSLNMTVGDGEIVALLGGDGSGKTTLLKVAAGVTDCEGEVLISGNPIAKRPDDVLMVFDDMAVFNNRSFYYNLAYPLKLRKVDKHEIDRRVKACAERMGITACLHERVRNMPLIDVKRLAIARLFLREYKALLIDDITNGLVYDEADELWNELIPILLEKAKEGVSIIYATHSASEATSIADRIAVMHYGELKQIGSAKQIYDNPSNIWAAQALDKYYHFERARLERKDGCLKVVLGVETPVSNRTDGNERQETVLDGSVFEGRIASGYEGNDVFIGWHSDEFAEYGGRMESVSYAVRDGNAYILHTPSGICVKRNDNAEEVCTLPKIENALLYDFTNENSIFIR